MKLDQIRPGVYSATMTVHELSVLLAGARMALSTMEAGSGSESDQARDSLRTVLADFDSALARVSGSEKR